MTKFLPIGLLAAFLLTACDPFTMFDPPRQNRPHYGPQQRPLPPNGPTGNYDPTSPPPPPAPAPIPPARGEYPVARRTANPDQVISPYEPFNVIDVSEFQSGQLARDPSNQKIFRVP